MASKDRFESVSKEGCGRVNVYKINNIIHSYTLECGFHCSNYVQELSLGVVHNKLWLGLGF